METMEVRSLVLTKLSERSEDALQVTYLATNSLDQSLADLRLDSLTLIDVLYDLEDHYAITIENSELDKMLTVNDLVKVVRSSLVSAVDCGR